jgi:UDP:flavonoid glycosyltransferase YjiC (YdhE family)
MGRDQREVAARAVWQGAGIGTKVDTPTTRLRSLIRMALSEPSLRVAGQLAARIAADDPDIAVRELEHIETSVRSTVTD